MRVRLAPGCFTGEALRAGTSRSQSDAAPQAAQVGQVRPRGNPGIDTL